MVSMGGPGMGGGRGGRGQQGDDGRKRQGPSMRRQAPTAANISFFDEEDNEYAQTMQEGHRIDPRARKITTVVVILVVVYFIGLFIPKDMINLALQSSGYNNGYSFSWFVESLTENVQGVIGVFTGNDPIGTHTNDMFRYIVVMMSGAGLALTGAVYQGSFRNALVSPSTMGVMSGASLGMIIWVIFFVDDTGSNVPWLGNVVEGASSALSIDYSTGEYLWATYSLSIFSFVGCMAIVVFVLLVMVASGKNNTSGFMIIITGQVIGGIAGSITGLVRYYYLATDQFGMKVELLNTVMMASFYRNYTAIDIVAVAIPLIACFAVVMKLRQRMTMLSFGKEEARSMGVDTKRMQIVVVAVTTLLTAILISFCGRVGFVGFLVPHLSRRIVGYNFKYLLPCSMAVGALFVLCAYVLVAATVGPEYETMTGMFVSIGGAAVFLVTALRSAAKGRG